MKWVAVPPSLRDIFYTGMEHACISTPGGNMLSSCCPDPPRAGVFGFSICNAAASDSRCLNLEKIFSKLLAKLNIDEDILLDTMGCHNLQTLE